MHSPIKSAAFWLDELLNRAEKHTIWHANRAKARRLHAADVAQEDMLTAIADIVESKSDADRDCAFDAAHDALAAWKVAVDHDAATPDAWHQCAEVDGGELGEILRCAGDLDALSRAERDGTINALKIAHEIAAVGFAAPGYPPLEES